MSKGTLKFEWVDGAKASDEVWMEIDGMLVARGWMALNRATSRLLLARLDGRIIGFHVFQLVPYVGPLFVEANYRGTGIADALADFMLAFLDESHARGWITSVESSHAEKMCKERGMTKIEQPFYAMMAPGHMEV